jgi:hypothetical protein
MWKASAVFPLNRFKEQTAVIFIKKLFSPLVDIHLMAFFGFWRSSYQTHSTDPVTTVL